MRATKYSDGVGCQSRRSDHFPLGCAGSHPHSRVRIEEPLSGDELDKARFEGAWDSTLGGRLERLRLRTATGTC